MLVTQLVEQNVEMALGPLETTIDRELERRFVEGSERVLAVEGHCRLVDRRNEGTSAGGAATEGTQAEGGAELASEIDEIASHVR